MNRRSSQWNSFCGGASTLVLALAFLIVPYLVDVAFLGDLTPTHFAQENIAETEDAQAADDKELAVSTDLPISFLIIEVGPLNHRPHYAPDLPPDETVFPHQYLIFASLISLPPPASQLS